MSYIRKEILIDPDKLKKHIKLCKRNIKRDAKCCKNCPFEYLLSIECPELDEWFSKTRKKHGKHWTSLDIDWRDNP